MTSLISLRLKAGQVETHDLPIVLIDDGVRAQAQTLVKVEFAEFGITIDVGIKAEIELVCSRCIETFVKNVDYDHNIIISLADNSWEIDDETLAMGIINVADNTIDIQELVRQLLVENQEMRPLCSEECQGLCPVCGINLNSENCECDDNYKDPRWSKLRDIKIK